MGFDNENTNMDELEAHLNRLDEVLRKLIVLLFILYQTELSFSGHGCGAYYRALRWIGFTYAEKAVYESARLISTAN